MKRSRPVSLALVGLFVWLTGCTSYRQIELAQVADYGKVRVTFADGERVVVPQDAFVADSLYVWKEAKPGAHYGKVQVWYPLEQVTLVEARHGDAAKTVGLVLLVLGGMVAVVAIGCAASECDFGIGPFSGN